MSEPAKSTGTIVPFDLGLRTRSSSGMLGANVVERAPLGSAGTRCWTTSFNSALHIVLHAVFSIILLIAAMGKLALISRSQCMCVC